MRGPLPGLFVVVEDVIGYVHSGGLVITYAAPTAVRVARRYEQAVTDAVERCPGQCIYLEPDGGPTDRDSDPELFGSVAAIALQCVAWFGTDLTGGVTDASARPRRTIGGRSVPFVAPTSGLGFERTERGLRSPGIYAAALKQANAVDGRSAGRACNPDGCCSCGVATTERVHRR